MLFTSVALAATASAFLVVPEISKPDEEGIFKTLPFDTNDFDIPATALGQSVEVPCTQCKGKDTTLHLDFAVEDDSKLMLNGFELYPSADPWSGDLVAAVVKGDGKEQSHRLGYSLGVKPEGVDPEQGMEVIGIELRVIEVGRRFVEGIPIVKVNVIKAPAGEILIGNIEMMDASSDCDSMWCRAKDLVSEMVKGFKGKGCGRMRHRPGHAHHGGEEPEFNVVESHRESGHHHPMIMHGEHHHHHWRKLLKNVISHIFLPVLMGVAAGVGVAVLAMIVCSFFVRLMLLFRGHRREGSWCAYRIIPRGETIVIDSEKEGLMEYQAPPPDYETQNEEN